MKSIIYPFVLTATLIIITFLVFSHLETYFSDTLNALSPYHLQFAIVSFVILASDIILPVPSSIVMYINGYILGLWAGALVSFAGLLVGAVVGYHIGRWSSKGFGIEKNERAQHILSTYGAVAILMSRGIPIISESICIVCGYNKMPFGKYFLFNLIGYIPLSLLYAFCGRLGYDKNTFLLSFGCSLVIAACFWFLGKSFFPAIRKQII